MKKYFVVDNATNMELTKLHASSKCLHIPLRGACQLGRLFHKKSIRFRH